MKIYVLTQGCYSDYHIITATTSKEKAEHLKASYEKAYDSWMAQHVYIEEFEDGDPTDLRIRYEVYAISEFKDFSFSGLNYKISPKDYIDDTEEINVVTSFESYKNRNYNNYRVTVKAESVEQGLKIAQDLINMYRAQEEGIC